MYQHVEGRYENKLAGNFEVLTPLRFLYDLRLELSQAKQRVWGQWMHVYSGYFIDTVVSWFTDVAMRGLNVRLNIDTSSRRGRGAHPYYIDSIMPTKGASIRLFQRKLDEQLFSHLQKSGAKVTFINPEASIAEQLLPTYLGRNHIKMAIVDDVAYVGGLNLADDNFNSTDFVVKITDPAIVAVLAEIFTQVNEQQPTVDYEFPLKDGTRIIVDCGKRGQSFILDTAVKLINHAKDSAHAVTLLAPDGRLLNSLYKAHSEGIVVENVTSHPQPARNLFGAVNIANYVLLHLREKNIPVRFSKEGLHAKLLLIDTDLPQHAVALFGSHNLSERGVQLGTAEIAMVSRNPILIANLVRFYKNLRAKTDDPRPF